MKLNGDRCQCCACHKYFNSTAAFDKHRTGRFDSRHCYTAEEMEAKGMSLGSSGFWITHKSLRFTSPENVGTAITSSPWGT